MSVIGKPSPGRPAPAAPRRVLWCRLGPALGILFVLAGCASQPPRTYPPLRYDYLLPLRLNVASVTVESRFVPGGANDLSAQDPSPPVPTLTAMAQDRLQAVGTSGRAVFVVKDASIVRTSDGIAGSMDVELDVYAGGGTRAAFAEARVSRRRSGGVDDMPSALYDMTKQLMDAMNVEFEYQVRRSLHDWLAPASATPAPVQQQALPPPGTPVGTPSAPPTTGGAATPTPGSVLQPPPALRPPVPSYTPYRPPPSLGPPPTQLVPPS